MDLVSDSPSFSQHDCHSCHGKVALGLLSAHFVVPDQEDFSCLGELGVYGKRVGRSEGKWPQSGWEGGTSFGLRQDMVLQESLVSWSKPCCSRRKSVSAQQGMARLIRPFY